MTFPNTISKSISYPRAAESPIQPTQQLTLKKKYELSEIEQKCLEALNKRLMSLASLRSYAGACEASESLKGEQETLFKIVKRSKYFENEKFAAANSTGILNQTGYSFSRKNLQRVCIPGAYLEGANLVGTNLRGADLTGSNLTNAVMNDARFKGAKMGGVRLGQRPLFQCKDSAGYLCLSHDQKRLIGYAGENVYIWDLETGKEVKKFEGHPPWTSIRDLILLPDGKRLALVPLADDIIRIWDLESGQEIKRFSVDAGLKQIAIFPHGKSFLLGCGESISIWDIETGIKLKRLKKFKNNIASLALFSNGTRLAVGCLSAVYILDVESRKRLQKLKLHFGSVNFLIVTSDGKKIASASNQDTTINIDNIDTGKRFQLVGHTHFISALALFLDGKKLTSGGSDKVIRVWDLETGQELQKLEGHTDTIKSLVVLPDGKRLVSGGYDKTIRIWDLDISEEPVQLKDSAIRVSALALDFDLNLVVASDRAIHILDSTTSKELRKFGRITSKIDNLALFPNGKSLISSSLHRFIQIWDINAGEEIASYEAPDGSAVSLVVFPDGERLATGSREGIIRIWDWKKGEQLKKFACTEVKFINKLALFSDGERLISGSSDGIIRRWNVKTGQVKKEETYAGSIEALALFSEEKKLVFGTSDKALCIWDLEKEQNVQNLEGHLESVVTLAVFSDNMRLASGSKDRIIRIWDLAIGKEVVVLHHPFPIKAMVLKNDQQLCAVDESGSLWMWNLQMKKNKIKFKLLWATNPQLSCANTEVSQAIGLSESNRQLMIQHGAK
ncbi:MAG: pentapeptide repeat-containing protein [Verrucomicrobia bacterium]|nr:pentapeptide repeat-containing protein [Verrucomicrobiota bacterium]